MDWFNKKILFSTGFGLCSALCLLLLSCGSRHSANLEERDIPLKHASLLQMAEGDGYTHVTIVNPWDTTQTLHSYVLVPDSLPMPRNLPQGTVIRTPVKRGIVFSSVHANLFDELDALDMIVGVCDKKYMRNEVLLQKINNGKVKDCGGTMAPDVETIISISPDALFLSPYQDPTPYAKLTELGVPIVECADYMETDPLARTEWIKFYSLLTGSEAKGKQIYSEAESEYLQLKELASNVEQRPKVLTELKTGDSWFTPAKSSTTAIFIKDAGGQLPEINDKGYGSVPHAPESVLMASYNADVWLVKYYQHNDLTYSQLSNDSPIYTNIKAFKDKNVYGCNTSKSLYYEETAFHPHWLLADMISLIHPELGVEPYPGKAYFEGLRN